MVGQKPKPSTFQQLRSYFLNRSADFLKNPPFAVDCAIHPVAPTETKRRPEQIRAYNAPAVPCN